jgi:hypothetical protein
VRHFEWRQHGEGVFQLRIVKSVETNGEEHELDEDEEPWRAIRYDFIEVLDGRVQRGWARGAERWRRPP